MVATERTGLTREQQAYYAENGYILVKGLLSREEAAAHRREAHDLIGRLQTGKAQLEATWGSARQVSGGTETQLLHRHNVEYFSAAFHALLLDPRITDVAANIVGSPNIALHHTKLFIKPPEKGSPFPMHQDHPFFPHERHSMIAAILHFDDAPIEKGCLRVVPGSHKGGPIEHEESGGWHLPFEQYPLESSVILPAEAGDVLFFSYLTIHGSGVNASDEARTTLLVQMRDAADRSVDGLGEPGAGLILRGVRPVETITDRLER
jgi:ectoine hydroxylase-related dioxygenase (phytanoyl-CoA dioxygenase family)